MSPLSKPPKILADENVKAKLVKHSENYYRI